MRTAQGIMVVVPGADYRPYCNGCSWKGTAQKSIPDAQLVARAHAAKCK